MEKTKLIKMLKKLEIVTEGSFVLHSGKVSNYYIDIKKSYGNPKLLSKLATLIAKNISKKATCVASTGHGGIPLATVVSIISGLPLILIRETEKDHGTMGVIEGYIPGSKDCVAIIDDVYTTGASVKEMILAVTEYKTKIAGIYVIAWRGEGKPPTNLSYIFKQTELK